MGGYTFIFFLVILISCIIFIFFFVPETKNRTFDEISRDLLVGPSGVKASRSSTAFLLNKSRSHTPAVDLGTAEVSGETDSIINRRKEENGGNGAADGDQQLGAVVEIWGSSCYHKKWVCDCGEDFLWKVWGKGWRKVAVQRFGQIVCCIDEIVKVRFWERFKERVWREKAKAV